MNTAFGFVVGLLQAALSLLGFVQANPQLPQAQKDTAVQVAQQAVTKAGNTISSSVTNQTLPSNNGFLASPKSGVTPLSVTFSIPNFGASCSDSRIPPPADFGTVRLDFGDGTSQEVAYCITSLSHTYTSSATYTARLIVNGGGPPPAPGQSSQYVIASTTVTARNTSAASISVPGMSKYTDPDFGFSFWYPSDWTVGPSSKSANEVAALVGISGDKAGSTLQISNGTYSFFVEKIDSQSGVRGLCGKCADLDHSGNNTFWDFI